MFCAGISAAISPEEDVKVLALINSIKEAPQGTAFIRNGTKHDAQAAVKHLLRKYKSAKKRLKTAQEFIDHVASFSSFSGKEYRILFPSGKEMSAREFFYERLAA
jgi:hypothetical protein